MATIDLGSGRGGKRAVNQELPLIPFIDFLLCLVAFLLVTAVWSQSARLEADARVPGDQTQPRTEPPERELHVKVRPERFKLEWREGDAVVSMTDVMRHAVLVKGQATYPELSRVINDEWRRNGIHRAPADRRRDRAVLHAENATPYSELIAVMDAIHAPQRDARVAPGSTRDSAFNVAFVTD